MGRGDFGVFGAAGAAWCGFGEDWLAFGVVVDDLVVAGPTDADGVDLATRFTTDRGVVGVGVVVTTVDKCVAAVETRFGTFGLETRFGTWSCRM